MMGLPSLIVVAIATAVAETEQKDLSNYHLGALKKMLYVRDVQCTHCKTRKDYLEAVQSSLDLDVPVREDLVAEYQRRKEYDKRLAHFQMTRDEFEAGMNEVESVPVDGARAERLWNWFQLQLQERRVDFLENGTISFSMPPTHRVSAYLHPLLVDAIEAAYAICGTCFLQLPPRLQSTIDDSIEYLLRTGTMHALCGILAFILAVDCMLGCCPRKPAATNKEFTHEPSKKRK